MFPVRFLKEAHHDNLVTILSLIVCLRCSPALTHGGAVAVDTCRVQVGSQWIHFTAYQPQLSGAREFCDAIPELGAATLVFDYEGKALRNMTVSFEITKEPEGIRVAYQPPGVHPNGSASAAVEFAEPGRYLAHVAFVHEGKSVDAHMPFMVATISVKSWLVSVAGSAVLIIGAAYILYLAAPLMKDTGVRVRRKSAKAVGDHISEGDYHE